MNANSNNFVAQCNYLCRSIRSRSCHFPLCRSLCIWLPTSAWSDASSTDPSRGTSTGATSPTCCCTRTSGISPSICVFRWECQLPSPSARSALACWRLFVLQCFVGVSLELEQGHCRVGLVYIVGGICGALANAWLQPELLLVGASAGVYAMLCSHVPHLVLVSQLWPPHRVQPQFQIPDLFLFFVSELFTIVASLCAHCCDTHPPSLRCGLHNVSFLRQSQSQSPHQSWGTFWGNSWRIIVRFHGLSATANDHDDGDDSNKKTKSLVLLELSLYRI